MVLTFPSFLKRMRPEALFSGRIGDMMEKATACIECHECETRCPYNLPIAEMLAEYYNQYEAAKRKLQEQTASE